MAKRGRCCTATAGFTRGPPPPSQPRGAGALRAGGRRLAPLRPCAGRPQERGAPAARQRPAVFLEAGESDTRVDALHARKMAARLQAATVSEADRPVLLRLEPNAGHGAGKARSKHLDELTDTWTFLFWQLGIGG